MLDKSVHWKVLRCKRKLGPFVRQIWPPITCETTQCVRIPLHKYSGKYSCILNFHTRTFLVLNSAFVPPDKINLQFVESFHRTFIVSPCSFSVVLRSNQWSKEIVSIYQTLLLQESINQARLKITFLFFIQFTSIFHRSGLKFHFRQQNANPHVCVQMAGVNPALVPPAVPLAPIGAEVWKNSFF